MRKNTVNLPGSKTRAEKKVLTQPSNEKRFGATISSIALHAEHVFPVTNSIETGGIKFKRTQLPLQPARASTIHKAQGRISGSENIMHCNLQKKRE